MGLLKFFKNRAFAKKIEETSTTELNKIVQDFLKKSQSEYNNTLKTAQTLNRASLMDKSTKKMKDEMRGLLDEDEDEDEEFEEEDGAEKMLMGLAEKFIANQATPTATGIEGVVEGMSPEQKKDLIAKFMK